MWKQYDNNLSSYNPKYERIFFSRLGKVLGGGGALCRFQGTKLSANSDFITLETYVQLGKQQSTVFHIWSTIMYKMCSFYYLGGPGHRHLIIRVGRSCFQVILSPISMYMSNKEAILKPNIKSFNI